MYLFVYHNLDADHTYLLFDEHDKAVQYALDEIKHYDEVEGVVQHNDEENITFIMSDNNEAHYTVRELTEINPTFSSN